MRIKPKLYKGGIAIDNRGSVAFNNGLQLKNIKRFYIVANKKKNFVRAWHGHKIEAKYMICISGKAKIAAVKINNFRKPSKKIKVHSWIIDSNKPDVVYIPPGYANGTKSITKDMQILVLSNSSLKSSLKDDFRFDKDFWKI
jgi:dTDP-4-dehydrorhamnose 3,5-epimerase-like enzyme